MGHNRNKQPLFGIPFLDHPLTNEGNYHRNDGAKKQSRDGDEILGVEGSVYIGHVPRPSSTSADRRAKNIFVLAIVIPEAKFCNVKGEIFRADFVVGADQAALQRRPVKCGIIAVLGRVLTHRGR
jgi:hypothetical protein